MPANDEILAAHRLDSVLVQFDPGASEAARAHVLDLVGGHAAEVIADLPGQGSLMRLQLGNGVSVEQALVILGHRPGVQFAEPDYEVHTDSVSNDPTLLNGQSWDLYGDTSSPASTYGSQAEEAWSAGFVGSTKVAAGVIDSGVDYTHPDLYLNIWLNQGEIPTAIRSALADTDGDGLITFRDLNSSRNAGYVADKNANGRIDAGDLLNDARWEDGLDQDANGYKDDLIGWDFANNDNDPMDDLGHGTHVSGTIAATGGNGVGVAGMTWSTQIVALKFLDSTGFGYTSNAVKATDYATAAAKAGAARGQDLVATNNSWGGAGFSQALQDAIVRGAKADVLFVASAGNGGDDRIGDSNDSTPNYPSNYSTLSGAGYEAVIAVASINKAGALSSFSNYGPSSVDIGAPGESIYSTAMGGGYAAMNGTSMAAPHVTGAVALYAAARGTLSAAQIRADIFASATATTSLAGKVTTGGRLDVGALFGKLSPLTHDIIGTSAADVISPSAAGAGQVAPGSGADTIQGMGGADTIDGGAGADWMAGGAGDDVYTVDNAADQVIEASAGGVDLVQTAISYVLPIQVENLTLTGAAAVNGTGNTLANVINGNAAANILDGQAGNDQLFGFAGNDTLKGGDGADKLDGGAGADRMEGGLGTDTYYVDNVGDLVVESTSGSTGGADLVNSTVTFTLGANVEKLTLTGTATIDGTGNALDNVLTGNGSANVLKGLAGADTLNGGAGTDTLNGGAGADSLAGGSGADVFVFARGEAAGDTIKDFALGDHLQLVGYSAGSTVSAVAGSTTDWLITDKGSGAAEVIHIANAYALSGSDFGFV